MRAPGVPVAVTLAAVLAGQGMLLLLLGFVVIRKVRRDRHERASVRRRAEFAAAIHDGSTDRLLAVVSACMGHWRALADLTYVLGRGAPAPPEHREALLEAAVRVGLVRRLRESLDARRPTTRGNAALTLAELGVHGVEPRLAQLLADPDPDVRLSACGALATLATDSAAEALLVALQFAELPPERIVERVGAEWAAPVVCVALRAALSNPAVESVLAGRYGFRTQLARALELAACREAEPMLLELLAVGNEEERISAARALGHAGGPDSIPALIDAIEDDSWPLRAQASRALGRLGAVEAIPALARRLADPAWWVRKQAGRALASLGRDGLVVLGLAALESGDLFARDRANEELRLAALAHGSVKLDSPDVQVKWTGASVAPAAAGAARDQERAA